MELEPEGKPLDVTPDRRPTLPQPLPVRLVAVADVRLPCPLDPEVLQLLDGFYVECLKMVRIAGDETTRTYQADNFCLILQGQEGIVHREKLEPTMIEVDDRKTFQDAIIEREMEFEWMRGLVLGGDFILVKDPAGNWIGVLEHRGVR
jgi:hypothetical protein